MERSIARGQQVTCSGPGERLDLTCTCSGSEYCPRRPLGCCSDSRGAGPSLIDDASRTNRSQNVEVKSWSPSKDNLCGGRASDSPPDETPPSDSDSDTQGGGVSSDDDTFTTEPRLPAPFPLQRNTFECGRRQSAPGQLVQDDGPESELQSRRPGLAEYFSSRKQRSVSQNVPGWKLFGKVPLKLSPSKQARIIQQEFEARQVAACSSPTHHAAGQQSKKKVECEPLSTTALILEDRPPNLPAKSAEETQRHRQQYEQMVAGAKRRELKEAQRRQQQKEERLRQEEEISNTSLVWNQHILPNWDAMRSSRRAQDLWWGGLPPSVRGRVWSLAVSNELNITAELYEIFLSRAKEKWRSLGETEDGVSSGLELVSQDVSGTLSSLCVFHKGGPYHDLLQSILGAYTCYRPDVGYVQGMSSMAAMLILNMDEVQVFISFSNLINRPCQLAFYRGDHQLMLRYFGTFQVFFQETLPRLFLHFQSSGVTPDLYLMDWILSLYMKPLPLDVACRVWDVFFRDGEEFLFRTALGILRLHQDVLLHMDLISIAQFLSRLPNEELLSDRLFSCILATPMLSRNRKWTQVLSSCRDSERSS
ncbi:TBC1 domain family member 12-like isoform X2 [Cebidichthys violaceus]|uniref:TBC1 domain family member 12-like isoform X2 n=1 Tax=Cebidichthys violaceus TaxID=271503 RepID=UPI0035CCA26A